MPIISWEGIGANEVQEVDVGSPWGGRLGGAGGGDGERRASKTVLSVCGESARMSDNGIYL